MWGETFTYKGHNVFLSAGGASLVFEGGDYTSPKIMPPKKKPTKKEMLKIADKLIKEYDNWFKAMEKAWQ